MWRFSLLLLAGLMAPAHAAPAAMRAGSTGLALYSDACVHPESGDLLGERIGVLRLNRGFDLSILYQDADGAGFDDSQFLPLDFDKGETIGPNISFTIDWAGKPDTFHGTITDRMIVGEFSNPRHTSWSGRREIRLPRVSLDQKGYPDCR